METSETTYDIHYIVLDKNKKQKSGVYTTYYSAKHLNDDIEGIVSHLKLRGALDVWVVRRVVTTRVDTFIHPLEGSF